MEVQQLEETVQQARERLERGEAPTDDVDLRVRKDEENRLRQSQNAEDRRVAADEAPLEAGTMIRTTAEQRPNAYVPDGDLGLPKPYGKHAPFKPTLSVQGNVSRFYRKSEAKELDFDA